MWLNVLMVLISYLLGNISFSFILTKIKLKKDIREFGSGNAGTTNVLRVLGKKYAVIVLIGDALKGMLAVLLAMIFTSSHLAMTLCAIGVILGHNWPALMGFRGGKGIATSIGVFIIYDPMVAVICVTIGVIIIAISKYVSLGSIVGMGIFPFATYFLGRSIEAFVLALIVSLVSIYKHRSNIVRLVKGNENKLKL